MKIITLTAENIKRLKAVDITPAEHVQIVGGRNAQGKTSVLDAIWLALGGGPAARTTTRPIRDGEDHASVRLDLGDLVVTRTWTGDKTALKVESADGAKYGSPQGVLDALVGRLSFDPLEFTRLSAREQVAALLDLVDLDVDLDALATERQQAYDDRAEIGRQGKAIGDVPAPVDGVPDEEVSASDLIAELQQAEDANRDIRTAGSSVKLLTDRIAELQREMSQAQTNLKAAKTGADKTPRDTDAIRDRLTTVEETNRAVRRNTEVRAQSVRKSALRKQYDALTATIDGLDKSKSSALAKAKFPVDGLGFDDSGVTFEGIPFSQASSAEQIRVSLAMAMSLNPKLRVIRILDGSLLDAESLALIEGMAKAADYQIWIERVGDADGIGVVIEDGQVASVDGEVAS
jgi:DNA repair exonuclease SbcCD ATPase subunit